MYTFVTIIPLASLPFADHSITATIRTAPIYCILRAVYFRQDRPVASAFVAPETRKNRKDDLKKQL